MQKGIQAGGSTPAAGAISLSCSCLQEMLLLSVGQCHRGRKTKVAMQGCTPWKAKTHSPEHCGSILAVVCYC